jgi:UDP-N-acetylmuramate--alanine ligase
MSSADSTRTLPRPEASSLASALAKAVSPQTIIRPNEPLAWRTTLRVGGPADFFIEPASEADLAEVVRFCGERRLPFLVLGRGSNLLVRDGGFRGAVISLGQSHFSRIEVAPPQLRCGAGARLKTIAMEAKRHDLAGFEFLEGIPGSLGGALRMNAGAMGSEMFEAVESVRVMDFSGTIRERRTKELEVSYRACLTLNTHIALEAVLAGHSSPRELIQRRMNEYRQRRWRSQPSSPSAGCIFKNPLTVPAGRLIEELGLKGARVGGASVSVEHGNFIVNDGNATARDILELIDLIRRRARAERGIDLETEVRILGEGGEPVEKN